MTMLADPENFVQTGFFISHSYDSEDGGTKIDELDLNEHRNLMMHRQKTISPDGSKRMFF